MLAVSPQQKFGPLLIFWELQVQGPLQLLLYYDLACFVAVCFVFGALASSGQLKAGWQWRAALMSAQIGYSLLGMPFFFASLPPWIYSTSNILKERLCCRTLRTLRTVLFHSRLTRFSSLLVPVHIDLFRQLQLSPTRSTFSLEVTCRCLRLARCALNCTRIAKSWCIRLFCVQLV